MVSFLIMGNAGFISSTVANISPYPDIITYTYSAVAPKAIFSSCVGVHSLGVSSSRVVGPGLTGCVTVEGLPVTLFTYSLAAITPSLVGRTHKSVGN